MQFFLLRLKKNKTLRPELQGNSCVKVTQRLGLSWGANRFNSGKKVNV